MNLEKRLNEEINFIKKALFFAFIKLLPALLGRTYAIFINFPIETARICGLKLLAVFICFFMDTVGWMPIALSAVPFNARRMGWMKAIWWMCKVSFLKSILIMPWMLLKDAWLLVKCLYSCVFCTVRDFSLLIHRVCTMPIDC